MNELTYQHNKYIYFYMLQDFMVVLWSLQLTGFFNNEQVTSATERWIFHETKEFISLWD